MCMGYVCEVGMIHVWYMRWVSYVYGVCEVGMACMWYMRCVCLVCGMYVVRV